MIDYGKNIMIDFRGDTFTLPTEEMRKAMYDAEVGNDTVREDETVLDFEAFAAKKLGKESAMLLPSGTMGNVIALLIYSEGERGKEIICERQSHVNCYEAGAGASFAGAVFTAIDGEYGLMPLAQVESAIRGDETTAIRTSALWIENPHNNYGGAVVPLDYMRDFRALADRYGLPVHLDGARLFNARAALGIDVREITKYADSVMVVLAKGLSAPVGAVIAGSEKFILKAHRYRTMLGGSMPQCGVIAAACRIALEKMSHRVFEDNVRAQRLARVIATLPGVSVDMKATATNQIHFDYSASNMDEVELTEKLRKKNILITSAGKQIGRIVVNRHITDEDILVAESVLREIFEQRK